MAQLDVSFGRVSTGDGGSTFTARSAGDDIRLYRYLNDGRQILADRVQYKSSSPWPDLGGTSDVPITRLAPDQLGSVATNWCAVEISANVHLTRGLFGFEFATIQDAAILGNRYMGLSLRQARWGDGDGRFDSQDVVQIFQLGKYETGEFADWLAGDWDGDGVFNTKDLLLAFQQGTYVANATVAASALTPAATSSVDALFALLDPDDKDDYFQRTKRGCQL